MGNRTFQNLPTEKRNRFISVSMHEFARNDFDSASISRIVRELGIAKGSVYQYFDDKKALWMFLKQHAEEVRLTYTKSIYRKDFPDFYRWFRALKGKQIEFHMDYPDEAMFLHRILTFESSSEVLDLVAAWRSHQLAIFEKLVEAEMLMGTLDKQLNTATVARFLQAMNHTLRDILIQNEAAIAREAVAGSVVEKTRGNSVISRLSGAFGVFSRQTSENPGTQGRTKADTDELLDNLITLLEKALK
jgi:AcrR family transcriptional regulator